MWDPWRRGLGRFVYGDQGGVMADICTAHGHLRWFIYPRPPDQASDLPEFVRLEGAPYHTAQFLTFHISSHFQLPVSLYHSGRPNPVQPNRFHQKAEQQAVRCHSRSLSALQQSMAASRWTDGSVSIYVGASLSRAEGGGEAVKREDHNSILWFYPSVSGWILFYQEIKRKISINVYGFITEFMLFCSGLSCWSFVPGEIKIWNKCEGSKWYLREKHILQLYKLHDGHSFKLNSPTSVIVLIIYHSILVKPETSLHSHLLTSHTWKSIYTRSFSK